LPSPPFPPVEPPSSRVSFPDPLKAPKHGVVAVGVDFTAGTLLKAYRQGIFPWPHGGDEEAPEAPLVLWFSPDPRCVFPIKEEPHWARSLRRTLRIHPYEVTVDTDFNGVMRMCGLTRPEGTWIIPELIAGYNELHRLGWAHSVEVWSSETGTRELVGGIYGVTVGGIFAGESMFHTRTDCSKIAFASLVLKLRSAGYTTFDVQVQNPHLESLGCIEVPRRDYLVRLDDALHVVPQPLR